MSQNKVKSSSTVPNDSESAAALAQLVAAARSQDREALSKLIEATQSRLFRFCLTLCGDRARAEDLCQEAFIKVLGSLDKLERNEAFMGWLFQITRNYFLDQTRSKASQASSLEDEDPEALGIDSKDLAEIAAVHKTLSQFDPDDQWLLLLVDLEEHSYREAAELMGISEDAVRTRLFRLRKAFLEKMSKV